MYGYKVKINSLPQMVWACETTVDHYEWQNRNSENMLEIAFAKFKTKNIVVNNNRYILKNNALSCVMGNEKREAFCKPDQSITTVSVAVKFSDFAFQPREITESDYGDESSILLPAFLEGLSLADELDLIKILHIIIKLSSGNSEPKSLAFISAFFELLYKIDRITRSNKNGKTEKNNYYIKKVNYMIESEYSQKITLHSVAKELNVSPVYLSTMYKNGSGIHFSDQLLNIRMKHAEKLLLDQKISTAKVAELCGFCDESYFRKKFKQFFGMNVREYRQIKNGLTLYHKKPRRKAPL